jgi:hypothetical protein
MSRDTTGSAAAAAEAKRKEEKRKLAKRREKQEREQQERENAARVANSKKKAKQVCSSGPTPTQPTTPR